MDLPDGFKERLILMFGASSANSIVSTFVARPTTLRINTLRTTIEAAREILREAGFRLRPVHWCQRAFVLENSDKREITKHRLYLDGAVYVQSLASMVPPIVLQPKPGEAVLDLTAAPGSKTSQLAAMMNRSGLLVANDINEVRFAKLQHNMKLLGVDTGDKEDPFLELYLSDGSRLCSRYENYFDKVLLDVPCSAEARFIRKNPRSFGYWSARKIKDIASTQRKLLFSAWRTLKPGGLLVYSTCTYAPEENELQIDRFLTKHEDAVLVPVRVPGLETLPVVTSWNDKTLTAQLRSTLRIKPTRDIEGFFVAAIRKHTTRALAYS